MQLSVVSRRSFLCKQEFQVKSPKEHLLGVVRLAFERERERESSRLGLYTAEKSKWVEMWGGTIAGHFCAQLLLLLHGSKRRQERGFQSL